MVKHFFTMSGKNLVTLTKFLTQCLSCDEDIFCLEVIAHARVQKIRKLISYDPSQDMVL